MYILIRFLVFDAVECNVLMSLFLCMGSSCSKDECVLIRN